MAIDPTLAGLVELAREDLAERLAVAADSISVVSAEAVVWPDAALGCPQPGMRYAQVPVDGALIRLAEGGRVHRYHTGGDRARPFLCRQPPGADRRSGRRAGPDPRLAPRIRPGRQEP